MFLFFPFNKNTKSFNQKSIVILFILRLQIYCNPQTINPHYGKLLLCKSLAAELTTSHNSGMPKSPIMAASEAEYGHILTKKTRQMG
jgi:hypothetical protein